MRILSAAFVGFSFLLISEFYIEGTKSFEYQRLKLFHYNHQQIVYLNLKSKCDLFEKQNSQTLDYLKKAYFENNIKMDLVRKKIIDINELRFYTLKFRSFYESSFSELVTTGYMVEHKRSGKCFGLI